MEEEPGYSSMVVGQEYKEQVHREQVCKEQVHKELGCREQVRRVKLEQHVEVRWQQQLLREQ